MEKNLLCFNCELCNKKFSRKSTLNRHVREQHLQPDLYKCKQCGIRFSKKYNLQVHEKRAHSKNLKQLVCLHCKVIFTKLASLKKHIEVQHKDSEKKSSRTDLSLPEETDAQTYAESVLKELKQLQNDIQSEGENLTKTLTVKDNLYPLGEFTLLKVQTVKHVDGVIYLICEFCGKKFKKSYNYLRHHRTHTKVRPFVCILCRKAFPTNTQLREHGLTHKLHSKFGVFHKLYNCPQCNAGFNAVQQIDKHLRSSFCCNVTFKCPRCLKSYKNLNLLLRHKHSEKDNEINVLKKLLPKPLSLREKAKHVTDKHNFEYDINPTPNKKVSLRHDDVFKNTLSNCVFSFPSQTSLRSNSKRSLRENYFKCHYCNKDFQTAQSCRRHMLSHLKLLLNTHESSEYQNDVLLRYPTFIENEKKYEIETKPTYVIKSRKKYKTQIKNENITMNLLKYKCSECEKSFRYNAWLKKHFKYKHTAELPYECNICLRKFRTKQSLENHISVHSDERVKITCQVCGKKYASSKSLKLHLRIHTEEKPFKCDTCLKLFRTSGHLIQHRKSNHK